ncbi:MAG: hypothetical protein DU429_06265 [Candidatus Tokpelaia sp.]|nr:MAG: hypothetical protein DU430_01645 [Candidatus Tokpelaia sp.]KAA6206325.1 MAG: hypothetical protein DU429_06265 [Candidatus Tokpelaia sp.]
MRETEMHEAEISPAGEIMVNKQNIGRIEGFRLALTGENPAGLPAIKAELAPLVTAYYEQQAERFAAAANADMAVDQDGFVRWAGWLIARLIPGEDVLHPGFVLLADDEAGAQAREEMAQRVRRFIAFYCETALKPLFDLAGAEALTEKPRFIALRLVEQLGVVPRREIAAELKELDQESRAALRRFGVRFGVYHVFLPALLKPAPAQALTLLWALKNNAQARAGKSDIVAQLMAGRTSFAVEEGGDRAFYRLAGYRLLGKRAVRIDMLERCADLIRHAQTWRPGKAAAPRPDGAYDGKYFTISQAMLSILGAKPEDMEEILRQSGYKARPVSKVDYRAFLQKNETAAEKAGETNRPAAEPVGDWPAQTAAIIPRQSDENAFVPAAEPVGSKFASSDKAAGEIILLWRYQRRPYKKPHKKEQKRPLSSVPDKAGQALRDNRGGVAAAAGKRFAGQQQKAAATGKAAAAGNSAAPQQEQRAAERTGSPGRNQRRNFGKPRNFDGRKQGKPVNIEDSPFAALAALRDKMRQ